MKVVSKGLGRKARMEHAHRVAWFLKNGEIPVGMFVCHKCDNPKCVNPRHLFLGTAATNSLDMKTKRRQAMGRRQGSAKLDERKVRSIRASKLSGPVLARQFGVTHCTIYRIQRRRLWGWLK